MRRVVLILFVIIVVVITNGLYAEELKKLSFKQVFMSKGEKLLKPLPQVLEWADDMNYYELRDAKLFKVNARDSKSRLVMDSTKHTEVLKNGFDLMSASDKTKDFTQFLFVKEGDIFLFSIKENKMTQVTHTNGSEENPTFSPDAAKIAYTMGGNLFVYDITGKKIKQLTNDGSEEILNGYASWVYFEEVLGRATRYRAFWWSPDSRKLVFMRFDQSKVPIFPIFRSTGIYGDLEKQRYPKPGYPNPEVKIGIADTTANDVEWIPFEDKNDHYLAFPCWNRKSNTLYFQWLNRDQNHLKVLQYDSDSKRITLVYEEKQKTWVDFLEDGDLKVLDNGDLLIRSSKSGWFHIYYVSRNGNVWPVTSGDWSVSSIEHINERNKQVFFTAWKEDPTETDFYMTDFYGKRIKRLTAERGMHRVNVSPNGRFFIDRYSSIDFPTRMDLKEINGKRVRRLGDSYSPVMNTYQLAKKEIFRIKTEDDYELPAVWMLPPDFDKNKKYPVVFTIYGGPGSPAVGNYFTYRDSFRMHFLAQEGIIVFSVDHRGSGHFGKKGMDLMYRNLGKWEMLDYIEAVKYLRTLPFVDSQKIGITGGSYGGYVTAMALTYGSDYFQYGIADASVIDWALYDSIYTERYMDTPKDNPEGYKKASVLNYIDKYKSGTLQITHGTMDDNVHMQNTIQFVDKIQNAGKFVELILYPGERHGIRKKRGVSARENMNFWLKHFFNRTLKESLYKK